MGDTSSLITVFLGIALLIFWRRYRSMHKPIKGSGKGILWPLLFLTPGVVWFWSSTSSYITSSYSGIHWGTFAVPLIVLTNYERRDDGNIYTKKVQLFNYFYCTCRFKVWFKTIYCRFRSTNGWFIILRSCCLIYYSLEDCLLYKV